MSKERKGRIMTHTAKHAPGPWQISAIQNEPEKISIIDADMCFVAEVWQTYINGESRQQAHATLIAAAPAMYEALKAAYKLLREWTPCGEDNQGEVEGLIETALAQAEGKQLR